MLSSLLRLTLSTSSPRFTLSTHCTWKMKIVSERLKKNSSRLTNHKKPSICMSTNKTGTLLFKLPDNSTLIQCQRYLLTKLSSASTDGTTPKQSSASSTQRNQRRQSICTNRHECLARRSELQTSTLLTSFSRSMRTTLAEVMLVGLTRALLVSQERKSSQARRFGKMLVITERPSRNTCR